MNLKFWQKREKKSDIVQFQGGVYYLGTSGISQLKLRNYMQAYRLSDAVFSCIGKIMDAAAGIPWRLYRQRGDKVIEVSSHSLVNFMKRPSKDMAWPQFLKKVIAHYKLSGNVYIRKNIGSLGAYGEVELLRPDKVMIKANSMGVILYEYKLGTSVVKIRPEEVLHLKTFNPENDLYGLPPVDVIAKAIDIGTLNQAWTISFLENEAMVGGKIIAEGMQEAQRERLKSQMANEYGGVKNAGKWLVLEGKTDAERFAVPIKDMDNSPLEKMVLRKACNVYKVPSELLGDSENKTYSNQKEARKALYEDATLPFLRFFRDELNRWLVPSFDPTRQLFMDYDASEIEALSEDTDKLWDRAFKATGGAPFLDRNEAREMLKYGKRAQLSTFTLPIGHILVEGSEKPQKSAIKRLENKSEIKSFWQKKENKERLWQNFEIRVKAKQRSLITPVKDFLKEQRAEIARKMKRLKDVDLMATKLYLIFDLGEEARRYSRILKSAYFSLVKTAGEAGMAASKGELYDLEQKQEYGFEFTEAMKDQLEKIIMESGAKINKTTVNVLMKKLTQARSEGWTIEELTQNLLGTEDSPGSWFSHHRTRRIARTEMAHIENYGQVEGYKQSEFVELKGWLCSFVNSREAHEEADHRYSDNPIPLDQPFEVGGEMMNFPGDTSYGASAANVINCRCTTFPEVGKI